MTIVLLIHCRPQQQQDKSGLFPSPRGEPEVHQTIRNPQEGPKYRIKNMLEQPPVCRAGSNQSLDQLRASRDVVAAIHTEVLVWKDALSFVNMVSD